MKLIELEIPSEIGKVVAQHVSVADKVKPVHIFGYVCLGLLSLFWVFMMVLIAVHSFWVGSGIMVAVLLTMSIMSLNIMDLKPKATE